MDSISFDKELISFIAATYECAIEHGSYQVETQSVLSKYTDVPSDSELLVIFGFLKEKGLIECDECAIIPGKFTLMNEKALHWCCDVFDRLKTAEMSPC